MMASVAVGSRQSSIEDEDHLQIFCVLVALGLALRPSVDRQEPNADLSKIWRGKTGPGQAPALACMRDQCGELQSRFKLVEGSRKEDDYKSQDEVAQMRFSEKRNRV